MGKMARIIKMPATVLLTLLFATSAIAGSPYPPLHFKQWYAGPSLTYKRIVRDECQKEY